MPTPQLILDVFDELMFDGFAGGGGASTGIERATGRQVDNAGNHAADALGMHRINHCQTVHWLEDIFALNPHRICEGRPLGLGWFSPDCKHFSKAKGGKPLSKKIRGLAHVILRWARYGTRVIYMENVEEIRTWGPLYTHHIQDCIGDGDKVKCLKSCCYGKPIPEHKGRTFLAFKAALSTGVPDTHPDLDEMVEVLTDEKDPSNSVSRAELIRGFGYKVEHRELRACDYGAPTIRKRLFLVARNDGQPIVWPEASHYDPKKLSSPPHPGMKPYRAIAECIDWSQPCHSIFLNKEEARRVRCRRPLAPSTLRRIATGIDRYVLKAARPFLVSLTHQGSERVESIDEPGKVITGAQRGEKGLVAPTLSKFHGDHAGRSDGAQRGQEMEYPLKTQDVSNRFALAKSQLAPFLTEHPNASNQRNIEVTKPGPTITAETKGGTFALVTGTLVHTAHGEQDSKGKKRGRGAQDLNESAHSILASPDGALASALLVGAGGSEYASKPKPMDVPGNTQTTENHTNLASVHMIQTGHLKSNSAMVKGADEPMRCQVVRPEHGVVAANMVKFTTGGIGQSPAEPLPVISAGSHSPETHGGAASVHGLSECKLVATHIESLYSQKGDEPRAGAVNEPIKVIPCDPRHALMASSLVKFRGDVATHPQAPDLNDPGHVVSADGQHHGVASAFLAQHNGGFNTTPGHEATEPISTISQKGSQQQIVQAKFANTIAYYGNDKDGQGMDTPARTGTTRERFAHVETEAISPLTPEQIAGALRVAAFLREHGIQFAGEYATITVDGVQFVIVDIGMRMLTARELFRAQGFPEDYIIDRAWVVDPKTLKIVEITLTKEQQIRMCGNSVCPDVAEALVRANSADLCINLHKHISNDMAGRLKLLGNASVIT